MKISIITICLNRHKVIRDTIESVLSQNYNNIEYIVIDGGSSDGSLEIINSYSSNIDCLISEPDNGIYQAINKGLSRVTGDVVGLLHAGDLLYDNNVFSNVVGHFKQCDSDLLYGHSVVYTEDREKIIRKNVSPEYKDNLMKYGWFPSHQSIYFKSSVFDQYGNYNENYKIAADYEFLCRLVQYANLKSVYLSSVLVRMELGGASTGGVRNTILLNKEVFRAIRKNDIYTNIFMLLSKYPSKIIQFLRK